MLTQNLLALLALALSVSSLPTHPIYPTDDLLSDPIDSDLSLSASIIYPTPTRIPSRPTPTRSPISATRNPTPSPSRTPSSTRLPHTPSRIPTSPPRPSPSTSISGNDGSGNQNTGNGGQNAANGASNTGSISGDYTIEQASITCGNAQLNCCNKVSKKGSTTNAGLLGAVFGSSDVGVQCSPLNIPVIGIQVPINKACDAKAACCQGDTTQTGVVNVGCIALASLV